MGFMLGTSLAAVGAAITLFALLPKVETFVGFTLVIGLYLIPVGALMARPWHTTTFVPMVANFVPLLAPANQQSYDTVQFYNTALAIFGGRCAAAVSFRLPPPLSAEFRSRRLLSLTLRDLRRLATNRVLQSPEDWEARIHSRRVALPDAAQPLRRAQLAAALSVGNGIIDLRHVMPSLGLGPELDAALEALAQGIPQLGRIACKRYSMHPIVWRIDLFFHLKWPIRWRMPVDTPEKCSAKSAAVSLRRMALFYAGA